jgi:hypothetical protein
MEEKRVKCTSIFAAVSRHFRSRSFLKSKERERERIESLEKKKWNARDEGKREVCRGIYRLSNKRRGR